MDSPTGKIVAMNAGSATVAVARTVACARCAAGKGCGAGLLGASRPEVLLEVPLPAHAKLCAGDMVRLELAPAHLLRAALLVYGLPLAGMVLLPGVGWLLTGPLSDMAAIAWAVAGLGAGLLGGRNRLRRQDCLTQFTPTIAGRADGAIEGA